MHLYMYAMPNKQEFTNIVRKVIHRVSNLWCEKIFFCTTITMWGIESVCLGDKLQKDYNFAFIMAKMVFSWLIKAIVALPIPYNSNCTSACFMVGTI